MKEHSDYIEEEIEEAPDDTPDFEENTPPADQGYACFRCGDCCRLWVLVNYEETDRIAAYTKQSQNEFAIVYWDRTVAPEECLVLKQKDGACVFLREKKDGREKYCGIYEVRPRVCRDYNPSLKRKECREGLTKYWGITATPAGKLAGNENRIKFFYDYLKRMVFGGADGGKQEKT